MPQNRTNHRKWVHTLISIALFLITSTVNSQWREGGVGIEDTAWKKSQGDFCAMLMITDDPDGLFEAWSRPPSPDYGPNTRAVSTARRGDIVLSFVIFSGCEPDDKGNCNCSVEYTAYFPDGSIYGHHEGEAGLGNQPQNTASCCCQLAILG